MLVKTPLPPLTADESAHSQRLVDRIRDEIERNAGWISFERYMEMALYEPGLGYYSAGAIKLGSEGDFVTAPEISPLFSRCLGNQCADVLERLEGGDVFELGAGSGAMASDLLLQLERVGRLPERYLILEVSADLRERQRARLAHSAPHLLPRVQWLDAWPQDFRGAIVANEVLDALPVHRFRVRGSHVSALGVTWQLGQLDWSEVRASDEVEQTVRRIEREIGEPFAEGYTSEVNLRLGPWIRALADAMQAGAAFFIDYGLARKQYYRSDRREGSLLCHFRHRFHSDPLINVGVQDIGAWVDFTAVAEAAVASEMSVAGYTTQAHFLIGTGIEGFLSELKEQDLPQRLQLARQTMVLTLPNEMGERFKVIGLTKNFDAPLRGFAIRDLAGSL